MNNKLLTDHKFKMMDIVTEYKACFFNSQTCLWLKTTWNMFES